ncbi:MAG: prepilin-type N-terminal cleavage/methylation domain-containing protein [Phycisphaera sp.]|nr:prepilin-type N-terminal cleavage/methylation domain-containing protein [Phycisphaera sp.]
MANVRTVSSSRARGFTLVEILVVVVIILALIVILTPSLERAIEVQWMVYCQFNCKNIGYANGAYALDNSSYITGPNWGQAGSIYAEGHGWLYYNVQMDTVKDLESGDLWPYLRDASAYRCPADRTKLETVPNRPNNSRAVTSYVANGSLCYYGKYDQHTTNNGCDTTYLRGTPRYEEVKDSDGNIHGYFRTFKISRFKALDVLYWEPDETKGGPGSAGWWWDACNFPWEGVTRRHLSNKNITLAGSGVTNIEALASQGFTSAINVDGSAEWMPISEFYGYVLADWYNTPSGSYNNSSYWVTGRSRLWNIPNDANGKHTDPD